MAVGLRMKTRQMKNLIRDLDLSDGYSKDHIIFKWEAKDGDGMKFVPPSIRMLPQYTLTGVNLSELHNVYVVGELVYLHNPPKKSHKF